MGDPSGIGPELILKLHTEFADQHESVELIVYGSAPVLEAQAKDFGLPPFEGTVKSIPHAPISFVPGEPNQACAQVQFGALELAVKDALSGAVDAIVTAPWTKHINHHVGHPGSGHTELLGLWCGGVEPTMMLCGDQLRVAVATTHLALRDVADALTNDGLVSHLQSLNRGLVEQFAIEHPRIAVCGLNPHAGERGLMGTEEQTVIGPAIERARQLGIDDQGPFPADTLFARIARSDTFDAVLAMYHDQGLVPLKLWHFGAAANVSLGLPIIRTSVDHGTAHDIAGRGVADSSSLMFATELALKMVESRRAGRSA